MSKSTPLNQLPATNTVPSFVNDQQRTFVSNAQQAAQQFSLPQSAQLSNDVVADDDTTIQEVLNQLNAGNMNSQDQDPDAAVQESYVSDAPMMYQQQQQQPMMMMGAPQLPQKMAMVAPASAASYLPAAILNDRDLKNAIVAMIAFVIVSLLPIERFVYAYISIDKIPYSNLIVKAVLCGVVVYVIKKLV